MSEGPSFRRIGPPVGPSTSLPAGSGSVPRPSARSGSQVAGWRAFDPALKPFVEAQRVATTVFMAGSPTKFFLQMAAVSVVSGILGGLVVSLAVRPSIVDPRTTLAAADRAATDTGPIIFAPTDPLRGLAVAGQTTPPPAPPAQTAAVAPDPAASTPPLRALILYPGSAGDGGEIAARIADELNQAGVAVADVRPVKHRVDTTSVRYFFKDDVGAMASVHRQVRMALERTEVGNKSVRLQDFSFLSPKPRRGNIEIWVAGSSGS